ncbi:hypothetical protein A7A78_07330 [Aequorivita soesokkakensis]|uniref:Uncharacterized protein n=1 Tax=Aequorivita soesokkakensis TaxID=1385699 RepID=A0A1A9LBH1_9FLAO|nr:hypothetical protein [Aequorivita soesokkakensis]OAD90022.1 hypothetical protein A7A78_07330 [Aequorivita soesokkakensis]
MASYKLEDNIREKLETRELKPSADAWKKLEAKLDAEQPKKKSNVLYYVAASFVGILILASVLFSRNNSEVDNQIVEEKIQQNQTNSQPEIIPNKTLSEEIVSEERNSEKINSEEKQKPNTREVKVIPPKKSTIDKKMESTEALANVSNEKIKKPVIKEDLIISEEDKLINNKVDEVVASVKKLQEDNAEISTTEVERLLNNARRDIQTQRILNSPKVDATALLQDVEWELDKSFRDKVFDALGEGFQKVRTAVSERND